MRHVEPQATCSGGESIELLQAADNATQEQEGVAVGAEHGAEDAADGLEGEEGTDPHEGGLAADLVGDAAGQDRADEASDDACAAGDALGELAQVELAADGLDGAVEDHALEAVEERAEGGDEGQDGGVAPGGGARLRAGLLARGGDLTARRGCGGHGVVHLLR